MRTETEIETETETETVTEIETDTETIYIKFKICNDSFGFICLTSYELSFILDTHFVKPQG